MSWQGINLLCFGGCYAIALAAELVRSRLPESLRGSLGVIATGAGLVVQAIYLGMRFGDRTGFSALAIPFDSLLLLAWLVAAGYGYAQWRARRQALGLFALPVVVALVAAASLLDREPQPLGTRSALGVWVIVHAACFLVGAGAAVFGFLAGTIFLFHSWRLKRKSSRTDALPLPSLERLERWNARALEVAFPFLTVGIALGVALVLVERTIAWTDPKIISAAAMWLFFAAVFFARHRPALRGRSVALLTIAAVALLLFTFLGVELLLETSHGRGMSS